MVELWVLLSLFNAFMYAIGNVLDKFNVSKIAKHPIISVVFLGAASLIASGLVASTQELVSISWELIALCVAAGAVYVIANVLYFKSIEVEEISDVVPLLYFSPLFAGILSALFLQEILSFAQYAGVALVVLGAIVLSLKKRGFHVGRGSWLAIGSSLSFSVSSVMIKYLLGFADFYTVFSYSRIGAFLAAIPVAYFVLPELVGTIREHGKKAFALLSLGEFLVIACAFIGIVALSTGPVTLIQGLLSIQPFLVLVIMVALSAFYPHLLKEEIDQGTVSRKVLAIALVFVGVWLIT